MRQDSNNGRDWQALNACRQEVNGIDEQIVSLLRRRQEVAAEIGNLKRDLGIEIMDGAREHEILRRLASKGRGHLSAQAIRKIFSEIISAARSVQKVLTVAYLGPEASFSHQSAISLFGRSALFHPAESLEEVFGLVEKGVCQQGVVPIENSYEGSVNSTLDLFNRHELKIRGEIFLRIRHHLLSGTDHVVKIKRLYSHPMAIAQCRSWIKAHLPGVLIKETESTSLAARFAADDSDGAAIGSRLAARRYALNLLKENIEDRPHNITRFLAVGKTDVEPTGKDKTSLLFSLNHKPGALYRALGPLARRSINMTRIESRPIRARSWEYVFFVDLEGHKMDGKIMEALKEMERDCVFMKWLGSYPAGGEAWD